MHICSYVMIRMHLFIYVIKGKESMGNALSIGKVQCIYIHISYYIYKCIHAYMYVCILASYVYSHDNMGVHDTDAFIYICHQR